MRKRIEKILLSTKLTVDGKPWKKGQLNLRHVEAWLKDVLCGRPKITELEFEGAVLTAAAFTEDFDPAVSEELARSYNL